MEVKKNEIIQLLHDIVETEFVAVNLSAPTASRDFINFCVGVNSFGLLSEEVANNLLEKYLNDATWRRVWGSVATQFEFSLWALYGETANSVVEDIVDVMDISGRTSDITPWTNPELASVREGLDVFKGNKLRHPNDFWFICILLFRLTMHRSTLFKREVLMNIEQAIPAPAKPKKQTFVTK